MRLECELKVYSREDGLKLKKEISEIPSCEELLDEKNFSHGYSKQSYYIPEARITISHNLLLKHPPYHFRLSINGNPSPEVLAWLDTKEKIFNTK